MYLPSRSDRTAMCAVVLATLVSACTTHEDSTDPTVPELSEAESALSLPAQCSQGWLGYRSLRAVFYPGYYIHQCHAPAPANCMSSPEVDACADALITSGVDLPKTAIKIGICHTCPTRGYVATPFDPSSCTGDEPIFPWSACGTWNYCKEARENGQVCYVPYGTVVSAPSPSPSASPSPSPSP